jgi:hypothetical protein
MMNRIVAHDFRSLLQVHLVGINHLTRTEIHVRAGNELEMVSSDVYLGTGRLIHVAQNRTQEQEQSMLSYLNLRPSGHAFVLH